MNPTRRQIVIGTAAAMICGVRPLVAVAGTQSIGGTAFGSHWRVTLDDAASADRVRDAVTSIVDSVDAAMSPWRGDSELSWFNVSRATGWQPASAPTCAVRRLRPDGRAAGAAVRFRPDQGRCGDAAGDLGRRGGDPQVRAVPDPRSLRDRQGPRHRPDRGDPRRTEASGRAGHRTDRAGRDSRPRAGHAKRHSALFLVQTDQGFSEVMTGAFADHLVV